MHYFAYGSNLLEQRLRRHDPAARFVGVGRLPGWRMVFHLKSLDGSAKCDAVRTGKTEDVLHGAMYQLSTAGRATLDQWEDLGGTYCLHETTAETERGPIPVFFYVGNPERIAPGLLPYDWYRAIVLAGARQRNLPEAFVRKLEQHPVQADLDLARARSHQPPAGIS